MLITPPALRDSKQDPGAERRDGADRGSPSGSRTKKPAKHSSSTPQPVRNVAGSLSPWPAL
ncbi:hypothetical protein LNP74_07140 [Klebsiella pneumoniae subsp. pneumoniae]|nr:hypothetical protein [Klebsiella pneumoniae subsp. pneumoniae]